MTQPKFKTNRLLLRQRTIADINDCLAMDRDPQVTKYIAGPWQDPDAHVAFVTNRIKQTYPAGLGYWTVQSLRENNAFLG